MTDAYEYGKALFLITEEDGISDKAIADIRLAESVLNSNPDYVKLLDSPALTKEERVDLVDKAFGSLNVLILNILKIMTEKRCVKLFSKAAKAYYDLYDESRGIVRVEVVSAVKLNDKQEEALADKLAKSLCKTIVIKNIVDPAILGGIKLRYCGIQLDGSVKTKLNSFEAALKNTVI